MLTALAVLYACSAALVLLGVAERKLTEENES